MVIINIVDRLHCLSLLVKFHFEMNLMIFEVCSTLRLSLILFYIIYTYLYLHYIYNE